MRFGGSDLFKIPKKADVKHGLAVVPKITPPHGADRCGGSHFWQHTQAGAESSTGR